MSSTSPSQVVFTTLDKALEIIPMFTGSISIFGSIATICIILRSHLKLSTTYHRILFGLSCCDVFQSLSLALSSCPVPRDTVGILYAIGNQATCNVQGFISVFGIASLTFYFCGLTGYFLVAIKMEVTDEAIQKYYEPVVHIFSVGYGLIGATFVAFHSGFGSSGNSCWIAPKPYGCEKDPDVECTSGGDFNTVRWALIGGPMVLCFCIILVNMMIIFVSLCRQNDKSHISMGNSGTESDPSRVSINTGTTMSNSIQAQNVSMPSNDYSSNLASNNEDNPALLGVDGNDLESSNVSGSSVMELYAASKKKNKKKSRAESDRREGMIQCLLYISAFLLSYFFPILYHGLDGDKRTEAHVIIFLFTKILYPLQGFFNFFIFLRPRMVNMKRDNSSYSFCQTFTSALKSRGDPLNVSKKRRIFTKKPKERACRRASERFSMIVSAEVNSMSNADASDSHYVRSVEELSYIASVDEVDSCVEENKSTLTTLDASSDVDAPVPNNEVAMNSAASFVTDTNELGESKSSSFDLRLSDEIDKTP